MKLSINSKGLRLFFNAPYSLGYDSSSECRHFFAEKSVADVKAEMEGELATEYSRIAGEMDSRKIDWEANLDKHAGLYKDTFKEYTEKRYKYLIE